MAHYSVGMTNARTIASLYARRRRLTLGLQDFERRAAVYRATIAEVEADLSRALLFVPPLTQRRSPEHFGRREIGLGCRDALRDACGGGLSTDQVAIFLMRRKGLSIRDLSLRSKVGKQARGALRRLSVRGSVVKIGLGKDARWRLA
jgi:hypothetical protein